MAPTSRPVACSDRIAVSRPEPGPLTKTSTLRMPCSCALRAAFSAAIWAANGVDLREPFEADVASARPGDHVAHRVGDGHDRVVERALDVGVPVRDVLLLLAPDLLHAGAGTGSGGHAVGAPT